MALESWGAWDTVSSQGRGWSSGFQLRKLTLAAVRMVSGRLGHGDTREEAARIFQLRAEA